MYIIYGIANCDTTKKAMQWLKKNKINFSFHDYKVSNIDISTLQRWILQSGIDSIFNKRSTTWRELPNEIRETLTTEKSAITLMQKFTSIIKRPIIEHNKKIVAIGFDEKKYKSLFTNN